MWEVSGPALVLTCGGCDGGHLVGFLAGPAPAADGHVLAVGAVGPAPDPVGTVQQGRLRAFAVDVVQEDQADALAERPVQNHFGPAPGDGRSQQASLKGQGEGGAGADLKPSCLQTTSACCWDQWSSHTVPQSPLWKTSTLPSQGLSPPTRRTTPSAPDVKERHTNPATRQDDTTLNISDL